VPFLFQTPFPSGVSGVFFSNPPGPLSVGNPSFIRRPAPFSPTQSTQRGKNFLPNRPPSVFAIAFPWILKVTRFLLSGMVTRTSRARLPPIFLNFYTVAYQTPPLNTKIFPLRPSSLLSRHLHLFFPDSIYPPQSWPSPLPKGNFFSRLTIPGQHWCRSPPENAADSFPPSIFFLLTPNLKKVSTLHRPQYRKPGPP